MTASVVKSYSMLLDPAAGDTGTGLDQLIDIINGDPGLAGANTGGDISGGAFAANRMNQIIVEAITQTGAGADKVFTAAEVQQINAYIRANHLAEWTEYHGDDEDGAETGFHLVQNDGATSKHRGANAIDTVADGLYHLGFTIQNGRFLNEDGDANATVEQVAQWLTQFYTDHSTTGTGLDRITNLIMADSGLAANIPEAQIEGGADAANGINQLIADGIDATGAAADGRITVDDVVAINAWIRADATRYDAFVAFHGDDENGTETGFHLVQGDGANTTFFGRNLVNTVADGLYHIGFDIEGDRFLNEDGDANQTVADVASWIDYFYSDASTTGTGLDRIVDTIKVDRSLSKNTAAADINDGAAAADGLNHLIADSIEATNAEADGWITVEDLYRMNSWVKEDADRFAHFLELHGDDENGSETGFHLVQNDGASTNYFGRNLVNTVADGMYHIGFEIEDGRFLNEDGDANQTLVDVSAWINYFYGGKTLIYGTGNGDEINGSDASEHIIADSGNDVIDAGGASDLVYGGWGCDVIFGGLGEDILYGQGGNDRLDGGEDGDIYRVSGNVPGGWSSFEDYDIYIDTGVDGVDVIEAWGDGDVDIGLKSFGPASGIERIDATAAAGIVTLLGDWSSNYLDFRGVEFVGDIVIDAGHGEDTIYGNDQDNSIVAGGGNDWVDGGEGSDTYRVTGNVEGGWSSFQDYDTYADSGLDGTDTIAAIGEDVDIGVKSFGPESGIEVVDGTGATGRVRMLGDWQSNILDFRGTSFIGNVVIDGGHGDDQIYGTVGDDTIIGGGGSDAVDGGEGSDRYEVTGNQAEGWSSFQDFDNYADSGLDGTDAIIALGEQVDIGLRAFGPETGIEIIDATDTNGAVRLLGDWSGNVLDFRNVTFLGNPLDLGNGIVLTSNVVIDGGYGNDTIYGNDQDNVIAGGGGNDWVDGGEGSDIYVVSGNAAGGWSSFEDYDTYADSGLNGIDSIAAVGVGDVDIGLLALGATSGIEVIDASLALGAVRLLGDWAGNSLDFHATTLVGANIVIDGGYGNDTIRGSAQANIIIGGGGNDTVDGGEGSDTYRVSGNAAGGWSSFQDYDTYADTGKTGIDTIAALGAGNVDIGLLNFGAASGIERIDGTGAIGTVRLLGDWNTNLLDFRTTQLIGANIVIDGGHGGDTIYGSAGANIIVGGGGNDTVNGGEGSDTYRVSGNVAGGWSSFQDYDTYADTGKVGTDTINAMGVGAVDIGLLKFSSASGIEVIDGTGTVGAVRLLGDWSANSLDFRTTTFVGANITIDGNGGDDTIYGSAEANTIIGGTGRDRMDGGNGGDTYRVTGNQASGWSSFSDFDTYADTGASGTDTIKAIGTGKVDIGLARFDANNGIDVIDATGATGQTRILGNYTSDSFDFSKVTFLGTNILIHAGDGDDVVKGSAGANLINGGNGNDTLSGGLGADKFLFDTVLSKWSNIDRIVDFSVVDDTIQLDDAIFKKAGALGTLAAGAFVKGTKALDASDRIVYNATTGDVFYDADGNGKGEAILFAKLGANLALTNADFVVV